MSEKPFGELSIGDTFTYAGNEYVKQNKVKISCCKFCNAVSTNGSKIGLVDSTKVVVPDTEEKTA